MFLISTTSNTDLHNIMLWRKGNQGMAERPRMIPARGILPAGCGSIYFYAPDMNLLVTWEQTASQLGVDTGKT